LLPTVAELDGWTYCPRCSANLRRDEAEGKVDCPECGFVTYASSKPTVGTLCVDADGRVLLSRRGAEPFLGRWDVPGGFLEEGEHPLDAVRREFREEGGVEVAPSAFLGAWMDEYGERGVATLNLYWEARIVGGELAPADDVAEFRWFALDEVPEDELAFAHLPEVLSAFRNQHA
jgi:ADP-ribose pyrophosphatase YjhB (NUDIX family)